MGDRFGHKVSKPWISTGLVTSAFLISLMYCTRFGYYLLDGVDRWINNLALVFVVWAEMSLSTTVYRYTDILGQTGKPAYFLWNFGYFGGQILGVAVGHGVSAPAGAGAGFGSSSFSQAPLSLSQRLPMLRHQGSSTGTLSLSDFGSWHFTLETNCVVT